MVYVVKRIAVFSYQYVDYFSLCFRQFYLTCLFLKLSRIRDNFDTSVTFCDLSINPVCVKRYRLFFRLSISLICPNSKKPIVKYNCRFLLKSDLRRLIYYIV